MCGTPREGSYLDELGNLNVPEQFAIKADQRAYEIFSKEVHFGTSFKKILGQIYMVGVTAGIEAARQAKNNVE